MEATGKFWKPGHVKPTKEDVVFRSRGPGGDEANESTSCAGAKGRRHRGSRGGAMGSENGCVGDRKTRDKKDKGKHKRRNRKVGLDGGCALKGKLGLAGPSQGLLALKFMQRKARADEALRGLQKKRDNLERDFSSAYAKRLKANKSGKEKDRLVCRPDEQDPALVVLGRRSFGGFNAVAEAAYDSCIRDIAAGTRLGRSSWEGDDDGDDWGEAVSDNEMAERLGKNLRGGRR